MLVYLLDFSSTVCRLFCTSFVCCLGRTIKNSSYHNKRLTRTKNKWIRSVCNLWKPVSASVTNKTGNCDKVQNENKSPIWDLKLQLWEIKWIQLPIAIIQMFLLVETVVLLSSYALVNVCIAQQNISI